MSFYTLAFIAFLAQKGICADLQRPYGWNVTSSASTISLTPPTTLSTSTSQGPSIYTSPSSSTSSLTTSILRNDTEIAPGPTSYEYSSSSQIHTSQQSSETLYSPLSSTAQSESLLTPSYHAYSTGVLPDSVQPLESKTASALSSSILIPPGPAKSSLEPPIPSSGSNASESASPTAQTAVETEPQASSTSDLAKAETASTVLVSEAQTSSSTWQVGISPSAYVASSALSGQPKVPPTNNSGYGGLGSLIWSGISGSLPTDNIGAGNSNLRGSSGYSGSLPTTTSLGHGSNTAPVSEQSASTILTGYTVTSHVVVVPSNGFGTGTGTNTGSAYPDTTLYALTTQTHNSQGFPSGSGSRGIYSSKYSFSWKFNISSASLPVGTGSTLPTGSLPHQPPPQPSPYKGDSDSNATCGGITVNIPNAKLDYWYTTALDYAAATFSVQFDSNDSSTGWTLLPATTTFNVTDALQDPTTYYVGSTVTNHANSTTVSFYTTVDVSPTPVYASTVVVTQTATNAINSTTGKGGIPPDALMTPPPASTVLSAGPNQPSLTALTSTHFVYFSQYALDTEHSTTHKNGTPACVTSREVKNLGHNFAMAYFGDDPDGQPLVTGALSEEFLKLLPRHIKLAVGAFTAEPTLIVPVQVDYAAEEVLAMSQTAVSSLAQSSAYVATSYLVAPTRTQPAFAPILSTPQETVLFLKPTSTSTIAVTDTQLATNYYIISPTSSSARVEKTQTTLDLGPGPTEVPIGGQTGAKGEGGSSSGGNDSGDQGDNKNPGTGSSGGSNSGSTGASNGGSDGGTSSGNSGSGQSSNGSPGNGGGSADSGSSGGSNTGNGGSNSGGSTSGSSNPDSNSGNPGSSGGSSSGSNPGSSSSGSSDSSSSGSNPGSSNSGSGSDNSGSSSGSSSGSNPGSGSSGTSSSGSNSGNSGNSGSSSSGSNPGSSNSGNSDNSGGSSSGSNHGGSTSGNNNGSGGASAGSANGNSGGNSGGSGSSSNIDGSGPNGGSAPGSNGGSQPGTENGSGGNIIIPVPVVVTIGSTKATVNPGSTVVIGTQTLVPQRAAVTIDGTPVSIGPSAVIVGTQTLDFHGSTFQAAQPIAPTVITYGGSTITQAPVPVYDIDGTQVHAGEVVTISGTIVSAAPSGGVLAIGSDTISIDTPNSPTTLSTAGRQIIFNPTPAFVVGSQTLVAGGPAVTVDGTRLSLAPSATAIVVGSETSQIAAPVNPTRGAMLTIGSKIFTADASTRFSVAPGVTLAPGGSATVDGKTVHLGPSGFLASLAVVDGVTQTLSPPLITPAPAFYMGGNAYGTNGGAAFVVDGQVLTPGGVITVSGTPVSFVKQGTAVVVGGFTQTLPQTRATGVPVLDFGGQTYTAQADSAFIVDGQTLTRGGVITVSGTKVSYASEGTAVVINGMTQPLMQAAQTLAPVLTVGGQAYTASTGSNFVINGATLIPGGQVIVDGTTISLMDGGTAAVINGVTRTLLQAAETSGAVLSIGGQTYTAGSGPNFVIGGQTLIPGEAITFAGTTVSLASGGTAVVVNGVTKTLLSENPKRTEAVLTIGGQTYTARSGASYVIGGQTLLAGSAVTVDGTTISLQNGGTAAVINGVTQTLSQATAAAVLNIGGKSYTAQSGSFVIEGQTLRPGAMITVDGTTVSLEADETIAVVDGATQTLAQVTAPAALTFGGHTYAAQTGSSYVIDGKTLTPGGVATLAGGTTVSLDSSGSFIVVNGVTSSIPRTAGATPTSTLTVNGRTFTASSGSYVIDGQTLTSGGVVTLSDGTTLSLGASVLVINGQTSTLPKTAQSSISPGIITIGGQTFTSLTGNTAAPSYMIAGQTLCPSGPEITVTMSGTTYIITLGAGASTVEIEILGSGGRVVSTIYETLRGGGVGASTVTATQEIQGGAATSLPTSLIAAPTQGNDATLQNAAAAPRDGVLGVGIAFAAVIAGALAVLL